MWGIFGLLAEAITGMSLTKIECVYLNLFIQFYSCH